MAFTVKTKSISDGDVYSTESNAIAYTVRWLLNRPAEAVVLLNDVNWASFQKYAVTGNDPYIGYGHSAGVNPTDNPGIKIEDPTNTAIFEGFIDKVVALPTGATQLHCYDLLYQLMNEQITYDTREDLDGSGLRESYPYRMDEANHYERAVITTGGNYRIYDTVASWANGAWTGGDTHYVVFSHEMAGKKSFWHAPYDKAFENDGFSAGDIEDVWFEDTSTSLATESDGAGNDCFIALAFQCQIPAANIDRIALDALFTCEYAGSTEGDINIQVLDYDDDGDYNTIWTRNCSLNPTNGEHLRVKIDDIGLMAGESYANILDEVDDTPNHRFYIRFLGDPDVAESSGIVLYYCRCTIHTKDITGNSTAYEIDSDGADYLEVSEDLLSASIDKYVPFSITKVITKYVVDLVGDYDDIHTIDTSTDLTASTDTCARHFHYKTPLQILQELAEADGTDFWLDIDGHLNWNVTYASAGTWTDSSVIRWLQPSLAMDISNKQIVLGMQYSDSQCTYTEEDATSQQRYGIYTRIVNNPAIYHLEDATNLAARLETRYKDPKLRFGAEYNGLTSLRAGTCYTINSTDLNTNTDYVATEVSYDSSRGTSMVTFVPKVAALHGSIQYQDTVRHIIKDLDSTRRHVDHQKIHTESWS
jgi:hypothetical protein